MDQEEEKEIMSKVESMIRKANLKDKLSQEDIVKIKAWVISVIERGK